MRLLLIRHGQTPSNVAGALDTGVPGAGLTPLGQEQARAVPAALAARGLLDAVEAVHVSTLVRTQLTAAPLARETALEVVVDAGLAEVSAGDLEMRSDEESVRRYAGCLVGWMQGDLDRHLPGGTDGHAFLARFGAAVARATHGRADDATLALVSHGAAIRAFTAHAVGLDPDVSTELQIMNTGLALLEGHPRSGWELAEWTTTPLGGAHLVDGGAHDVTGESADDAAEAGDA